MDRQVSLPTVLGLHLVVALVHGSAHGLVPVALGPVPNGLVLLTVFVGPTLGVVLDRRGHPIGVPLFTLAMVGALVLGGTLHFVVENPDHVAGLPASPWAWLFRASAVGVLVVPAVGAALGARAWAGPT